MKLPYAVYTERKTKKYTIGFKGLNRTPTVNEGELTATKNVSAAYLPCLTLRSSREVVATLTDGQALFPSTDNLCWVDGTNFVYGGEVKGTVTKGTKSMCMFNDNIIIMPDKKYYNITDNEFGTIGSGTYPETGSCPDMDYICEHMNRLWGVKGNNIYASKLGDFKNWTAFPGLETDSYATDVASEGNFTGVYNYANHVVMTKPDCIHELYGYKPSNFQIQRTANKGCLYGKSIVEVNGALFFVGRDSVYSFTGSVPRPVSIQLNENYNVSTAGRLGHYYYLSLYNGSKYNLYVYDTLKGVWLREDDLQVKDFAVMGGDLFALGADNKIYKFNSGVFQTETIDWEVETEIFTEKISEKKGHSQISIRVDLEQGSTLNIYYRINNGDYVLSKTFNKPQLQVVHTYMIPQRAEHFQIKLSGRGKFKLYEIERKFFYGSDA